MNQIFDFFETSEIPSLVLCTPNKNELFSLSLANGIKNTLRYNAQSGLEFSYPQSADGGVTADPAYEYILGKMLILVGGTTYYTITSAPEDCSGSVPIKAVSAISLEAEMLSRRVTGFSGTYAFAVLLQKILDLIPTWTIGTIDTSLLTLYRTFESNNRTVYSFLVEDMEKAFGCIFEFDTLNRIVSAIANTIPVVATNNIYLSFDNLIKSTQHKEVTEELCTALYCYGGEGLDIHYVNPLGTNVIYNFDYFKTTDWMSQELIDALDAWEVKVATQQPIYATLLTNLETYYAQMLSLEIELTDLNSALQSMIDIQTVRTQQGLDVTEITAEINAQKILVTSKIIDISSLQADINNTSITLREIVHDLFFSSQISFHNFEEDISAMATIMAALVNTWTEEYNSTSTSAGFNPVLLASETPNIVALMADATSRIATLYVYLQAGFSSYPPPESNLTTISGYIEDILSTLNDLYALLQSIIPATSITDSIDEMRSELIAYTSIIYYSGNMTTDQYLELSTYIYENTYTNSNIIITDSMSPGEIQTQSQELYDQALNKVLPRASTPRYEFTGEFSNFVAVEGFSDFTDDLELGSIVTIQKADNTLIGAVLLEIGIAYDNPEDFSMTFSNSFRLDNSSFIYSDLLGAAAQLGSNVGGVSSTSGSGGLGNGGTTTIVTNSFDAVPYLHFLNRAGELAVNVSMGKTNDSFFITAYKTPTSSPHLIFEAQNADGTFGQMGLLEDPANPSVTQFDLTIGTGGSKFTQGGDFELRDYGGYQYFRMKEQTTPDFYPEVPYAYNDGRLLYPKSDGWYDMNYLGVETKLGGGSSGDNSVIINCVGTDADRIAIKAAIAGFSSTGGRIILTGATCGIGNDETRVTSGIVIPYSNITIEATAIGYPVLEWLGSNYGTMIEIIDPATPNMLSGITLRDLKMDGNNSVSTFISANNVFYSDFINLRGINWAGTSGAPGYAVKLTSSGAICVSGFQSWVDCHFYGLASGVAPCAPSNSYAYGLSIGVSGTYSGSQTDLNEIEFVNTSFMVSNTTNAVGIKLGTCDHILFTNCYAGAGYGTPTQYSGNGLLIAPQKTLSSFPNNVTFTNTPILGGVKYDTTIGTCAQYPVVHFHPYYTLDNQIIPPLAYPSGSMDIGICMGETDTGYKIWTPGWVVVGTDAIFLNGWSNYDTINYDYASYNLDQQGFVHLKGLIKPGTSGTAVFALPSAYRPTKNKIFSALAYDSGTSTLVPARVEVAKTSGNVIATTQSGAITWLSLEGISFKVGT